MRPAVISAAVTIDARLSVERKYIHRLRRYYALCDAYEACLAQLKASPSDARLRQRVRAVAESANRHRWNAASYLRQVALSIGRRVPIEDLDVIAPELDPDPLRLIKARMNAVTYPFRSYSFEEIQQLSQGRVPAPRPQVVQVAIAPPPTPPKKKKGPKPFPAIRERRANQIESWHKKLDKESLAYWEAKRDSARQRMVASKTIAEYTAAEEALCEAEYEMSLYAKP